LSEQKNTAGTEQPEIDGLSQHYDATMEPIAEFLRAADLRNTKQSDIPKSLYHYTTLHGFKSIIESRTLWATDYRYLNDTKEISYGVSLISERLAHFNAQSDNPNSRYLFEIILKAFSPISMGLQVYCVSFTEANDDLSQWRGYGTGMGGICLEMDVRQDAAELCGAELLQVVYDLDKQLYLIDSLIADMQDLYRKLSSIIERVTAVALCSSAFRTATLRLALRFKNAHWKSEQEWRLIVADLGTPADYKISHRAGTHAIIPYLELPLRSKHYFDRERLPLIGARVGPSQHQETMLLSIVEFLGCHDYLRFSSLDVSASSVPLR
jgi:hypothetical protein